jgi:hypothetical protein
MAQIPEKNAGYEKSKPLVVNVGDFAVKRIWWRTLYYHFANGFFVHLRTK